MWPINLGHGICVRGHVINNLEHTFMDSAISAAFNPIALYGTYMRLYIVAITLLYTPPSCPFILLYFLHFIPVLPGLFLTRPGAQLGNLPGAGHSGSQWLQRFGVPSSWPPEETSTPSPILVQALAIDVRSR